VAGAVTSPGLAASLRLGHWHRMRATPPRMTRVELMDRALRRAAFRNRNVPQKTKIDRSETFGDSPT
jgi:hypothetical protein